MNKEIFFLSSLPRAGNTVFGSIINQNSKISVTANSYVVDILWNIHQVKNLETYHNFKDEKSINNVIKNVFNNYYKDWKSEIIIDRAPWGTPGNLTLLKSIIDKPKFIILQRPVLECLASFIKIEKPKDVIKRCYELMDVNGIIGKALLSIQNIISNNENYLTIEYSDFVVNPKETINKLYSFLKIQNFYHYFDNLSEFKANNIQYDDSILPVPLHSIHKDKLELDSYNFKDYLPEEIITEFSNL